MPARTPPPSRTAVALLLGTVVITLGAAGPAAALAAQPVEAADGSVEAWPADGLLDGVENTTNETAAAVEGTTNGTLDDDEPTEAVVEPSTDGGETVNSTAESLASTADAVTDADGDPTAALAEPLSATLDGTGELSAVGAIHLDGDRQRTATTPVQAGASGDNASVADGGPATGGSDLPTSAGVVAVGGMAAGALAFRHLGLPGGPWRAAGESLGWTARAAVGPVEAGGWRGRFWRLAGLFGYQRFDDSDPLEHETRAAVHEYIETTGVAYLSEISRETAVPLSTVRYHLRILEHEGLVSAAKLRGRRLYVPAGAEATELEAALKNDGAAAVLRALARHGPDSVSGLAERLGRDVSTVSHHLQGLADADLVTREREGPAVVNRLAPAVRGALVEPDDAVAATTRSDVPPPLQTD